jgi:hypothetical protein
VKMNWMIVPFLMLSWMVTVIKILFKTVWEDMNNYKGQRENFTGSVGPQGALKQVTNCGCLRIIFQQGICGKNC